MIQHKQTYNLDKDINGIQILRVLFIPESILNNYYQNLKLMEYLK